MIILIRVEFQGLSRHGKRTLENYGFSRVSKTLLTPPFFVRQLRQKPDSSKQSNLKMHYLRKHTIRNDQMKYFHLLAW